ncbi:lytic transglycosylase domain-containing protein, partial [bacterium]|nr:lytic transglycosylase domain-containing protein [bacterium]
APALARVTNYLNFDPAGRLGQLKQEARQSAQIAVARQAPVGRELVIQTIRQAAAAAGQDPIVVIAVAMAESRLDPFVTSPMGAQGLMQLMPATARRFGCDDPFDVYENAAAGARYLTFLLDRYGGDLTLALAAYNAGPAPVDRMQAIPPIGETQAFVAKVKRYIDELRLEMP